MSAGAAPAPARAGRGGDWLGADRDAIAVTRILDAATSLFAERGVTAVSMADVATAAGCSRATVYRYFANRDALRAAFVDREARRIAAAVAADIAGIDDPATRLTEAVLAALDAVRSDPMINAWFSSQGAATATTIALSSEIIDSLASGALGRVGSGRSDPGEALVSRWLVRSITSLLTAPGEDAAEERAIIERFVVPVVLGRALPGAPSHL